FVSVSLSVFLIILLHLSSTLFPYTTLFRSSGGAVVFDGSASTDPDKNDIITMYRWVLTSTNPDAGMPNPFIAEGPGVSGLSFPRSEEHTSELQSLTNLVCRLLLEKKKYEYQ